MSRLRVLFLAAALMAGAVPAAAQQDVEDGFNLIEEGAKLLLKGLTDEMEPMMEGLATELEPRLRQFAEEMAPMLEKFADLVDNLDAYEPPERLPNGDIILRRKTPLPDAEDPFNRPGGQSPEDGGQIEI